MSVWVSLVKVEKFPAVLNASAYKRIGSFRKAVKAKVQGIAVWARVSPGAPSGSMQVDVESIPSVPALLASGRPA